MTLSSDRDHGLRKALDDAAITYEADSQGIRSDLVAAIWGNGATLPSGSGDVWIGRLWWHTTEQAFYAHNGTSWVPLARGEVTPWVNLGVLTQPGKSPVRYRRVGELIQIKGFGRKVAGTASMAQIPSGFRIAADQFFVDATTGTPVIRVNANGTIVHSSSAALEVAFDIEFPTWPAATS